MPKLNLITAGLAALALAASVQPAAAQAAASDQTVSVRVQLADLDLSGKAGAKTAFSRIKAAAGEICGPSPAMLDVSAVMQHRRCVQTIVDRSVSNLGSPMVTALASGHDRTSVIAANR